MPRNSSGTYSLPAGNPVVTATPITIAWANGTMTDLGSALTDSLSRSGDGSMTAPLELTSGVVGAPSLTFSAEATLGLYRVGAAELGVAVSGTKVGSFTASGFDIVGALTVSTTLNVVGNFSVATNKFNVTAASGNTAIAGTLGVTGASTLAALAATTGAFSSTLAATGDFAINTNKFTVTAASGNTLVAGTLAVTGASTIAALSATSGTFSTTLGVSGASTLAALSATTGSFSGVLSALSTIELGHATQNTLSGSGGVLSVEGHAVATVDQAQTISAAWNFTTAPQVASLELGNATDTTLTRIAAGRVAIEGLEIGYRNIPQNIQNTDYTCVLADSGKHVYKASGGAGETITIPANASVAYDIGTAITIINQGGGTLSIAITSDTMTLIGTGATGTRTLADDGMATAIKVAATEWVISGVGIT